MDKGSRYKVPGWLDPLLPEVRPPVRICLGRDVDGARAGLEARYPDGTIEELPPDIERAYDVMREAAGTNIEFSKGVVKRHSKGHEALLGRSIACPVEGTPGYTRLLITFTDADCARLLEDAWARFLAIDRRWRKHPTFYHSFAWLSCHPAFWTRELGAPRPGDANWSDESLWDWQTNGYVPDVFVYQGRLETTKAVVALEAGAHVPDSEQWDQTTKTRYIIEGTYTEHYHDLRLDVSAATYAKAIRKLARRVDRYFDVDGSERPGVRHKRTKLEKTLSKRAKDVTDDPDNAWPTVHVAFADSGEIRHR